MGKGGCGAVTVRVVATVLVTLGLFSACSSDKLGDGLPAEVGCSSCHGSEQNAAPPSGVQGQESSDSVAVGAHQQHLKDGSLRKAVGCQECHRVPERVDAPGHIDQLPAEVTFGALATADSASPSWDRSSATCSGVYCHGATLAGGSLTEPQWTKVDGSQAACGTCHGVPPPAPHPAGMNCNGCHPETVTGDGSIDVAGGRHIDGQVQVGGMSCTSCHGSDDSAAPPPDTRGNTDTGAAGVGAHQSHLGSSSWHAELACSECHPVPEQVGQEGHIDGEPPADIEWGQLARADGADPQYDLSSHTCSGVYCHGETLLPGGSNTTPVWTDVGGGQAACGTCHGLPPGGVHPASSQCEQCHGEVIGAGMSFVAPQKHIDGQVEVQGVHGPGWADGSVHGPEFEQNPAACQACHGQDLGGGGSGVSCDSCHAGWQGNCLFCHGGTDNQSGAPPESVAGDTSTGVRGVGAHTAHVTGNSSWHADISCSECHTVPADVLSPGHIDPRPAELTWSGKAVADGAAPSFDGASGSCSGVYCHGETLLPGGSNTTPVWTDVGGGQAACGTCHGLPPGGVHPASSQCEQCHGEVIGAGMSFVAPQKHIDGQVEADVACGTCHAVPPTGPANEDYPGGGGAHTFHAVQLGLACRTCHGHDGTGPQHNQGNAVVSRANVDIVFDPAVSYPGGTTMNNGGTASHDPNGPNPTCLVGCHNPVVGDRAELTNQATWADASISCADCHERSATEPDINHDLDPNQEDDATIRASCSTCHDYSTHSGGQVAIQDPDTQDGFSYQAGGLSGLCRTCHDGTGGPFFGGQSPADQSVYWTTPTAHDGAGLNCDACHDHHGSLAGTRLVEREETLCAGCHGEAAEMSNQSTPTHHHVVDSEQSGTQPLECTSCHDPHVVQANPWRPMTYPDTGALVSAADVLHDAGQNASAAWNDNGQYCLRCHDGGWPGALDVAAELQNEGVVNTGFARNGKNLHFKHVDKLHASPSDFPCTYCHNVHGNSGSSGINRGALLYDWLEVREYPYRGKGSCRTSDPLRSCH